MSLWIGTANQQYASYAMEELRRMFPGVSFAQLAPGEVFRMECSLAKEQVQEAIISQPPIFLRHLQPIDREVVIEGDAGDLEQLSDMIRNARLTFMNRRTAVHIRRNASSAFHYTASDTKAVLDAVLEEIDAEPVVQEPEVIISIYAANDRLYAGFGTPEEMLSDWPGGAVRFQREEGQISRAKFKLLEAERTFGIRYSDFKNALDIGAAPGGWSSLLLERGLRVTAVDPADMHPSLGGHPALTHLKQNASDVSLTPESFDLLVCDMSWSPMLMCRLVLDLKAALKPEATAVITIKLMHKKPLQTIREVKERLETGFRVLGAKQLFHNREEMTLYLKKK
ncbi:SAM-dependent methyltransferase [Paenibacillus sp. LHD-117]|uniref:SAM-dependent methyltransferase n=1 Tax=Paenibacillus sp. LHD-117 TaxID=3071412 RepID=UPI0027E13750|nr:SAM-dependent methyltransferase [Paenibacillus sp. LHD-117]MDQ6418087.1 SAM-dependent methyltransferase [Paenibacillus sp. LHD-117]